MNAKCRMLEYIDIKGISQYEFSKKTGLSNGFLKSGSNISSDNVKRISIVFVDLNLIWLITGIGAMFNGVQKSKYPVYGDTSPHQNIETLAESKAQYGYRKILKEDCDLKDFFWQNTMKSQQRTIESLQRIVENQQKQIDTLHRLLDKFQLGFNPSRVDEK